MKKYFSIVSLLTVFFLLSSCKGDNKQVTKQKTIAQQNNNIEFESLISEGQEHLKNMQLNRGSLAKRNYVVWLNVVFDYIKDMSFKSRIFILIVKNYHLNST